MAEIHCRRCAPGWKCSRPAPHIGPCAARPTWWNRAQHVITRRWV